MLTEVETRRVDAPMRSQSAFTDMVSLPVAGS